MSEGAGYAGGWGVNVPIASLWSAAYAWRSVRLFRLVRLRQQNTCAPLGRTSLASLPPEISSMIEKQLITQDLRNALRNVPMDECVCDDFWDDFDEREMQNEFRNFCLYNYRDYDPDENWQAEKWVEFRDSDCYWDVRTACREEHEWECEGIRAGRNFWTSLLSFTSEHPVNRRTLVVHITAPLT